MLLLAAYASVFLQASWLLLAVRTARAPLRSSFCCVCLTIGRMLAVDELLAFRKFFELRAPDVKVELLSLDLQPTWRPYVEAMGMGFDQW